MAPDDLAGFLFEIASPERLAILRAVGEKSLRHAGVADRLSMTGSETTRHLNRLVAAGLVAKNPAGEYSATPLARLLLAGLPLLEFLTEHRRFLLDHDLSSLDPRFVARLGELGQGSFTNGTYHVVAVQDNALRAVERRIWVATEQMFEQAIPIFREKVGHGVDVRVIRPLRVAREEGRTLPRVERNFPVRLLPEVGLFVAVLDDQAGICFPTLDGRVDMSMMLLLKDPAGYRWAEDLFAELWARAREWRHPSSPGQSPRARESGNSSP